MNNTQTTTDRPSTRSRHPRPRTVTRPVAVPATPREMLELRDLLEANLHALQALHAEHRRMLDTSLRSLDGMRSELRAISNVRAPWVRALSETRALLFVALRELVVGAHEAELASQRAQDEPADPHHRTR
jgi:hypothetical protein